jgi:hypothetical protein
MLGLIRRFVCTTFFSSLNLVDTVDLCLSLCESGVNPEALAAVIKELALACGRASSP